MYSCSSLTIDGYKDVIAYSFNDSNFYDDIHSKYSTKKYCGFCTFDIETSRYQKSLDEYESFMYISQICIEDKVIFLRTWNEVVKTLECINNCLGTGTLVVYVHNLAYEFQFMKDFFNFTNIFSIDEHTILKATTDSDIEFRCSYKLSNMNLLKFIENTPHHFFVKAKDDLDYSVLRTPKTNLTSVELGYCYNDVRALYHSIAHLLEDDTLDTIPLTSTGYVRRECRQACRNKEDRKRFKDSIINVRMYKHLRKAFRGGNTASSRFHTNEIIKNVFSYDEASAYPYAMMMYDYPVGRFKKASIESNDELFFYNAKYCTIATYHFINLRLRNKLEPIPYLSYSKCEGVDKEAVCYNGRVISAMTLTTTVTNIDFKLIDRMYEYDEIYIENFYYCKKKKLSKELRKVIMKFYYDKTTLKGNDEMKYFYQKQKNKLNSIYGMFVSQLIRDEYIFDVKENRLKKIEKTLAREVDDMNKYNSSYNSFLNYQCGVFVTSYARMMLQELIDVIGIDVIYCDTDSVKFIGNHIAEIEALNRKRIEMIEKLDIPCYVDFDGKRYYMGIFEREKPYDEFITLGAKKYAYVQKGKIGVTVSGLNKKNAPIELAAKGGLKAFKKNTVFKNSGRITVEYHHDKKHFITVNGEKILTGSYINMFDTTYTLGINDTMLNIIDDSKLQLLS